MEWMISEQKLPPEMAFAVDRMREVRNIVAKRVSCETIVDGKLREGIERPTLIIETRFSLEEMLFAMPHGIRRQINFGVEPESTCWRHKSSPLYRH